MNNEFILSQTDGRPMYVQIMEQIKKRISLGDWPPGFKLPSIRELAVATTVSVITVKRAYQELEAQGVIFTQQGKGCFVSYDTHLEQQIRETEMTNHLSKALDIAETLGMTLEEVSAKLVELYQSKSSDNENKS